MRFQAHIFTASLFAFCAFGAGFFCCNEAQALKLKSGVSQASGSLQESGIGVMGFQYRKGAGQYGVVTHVYHGTPASRVGILSGDRIIAVKNQYSNNFIDIRRYNANETYEVMAGRPGDPIEIEFIRNGARMVKKLNRIDMVDVPRDEDYRRYLDRSWW